MSAPHEPAGRTEGEAFERALDAIAEVAYQKRARFTSAASMGHREWSDLLAEVERQRVALAERRLAATAELFGARIERIDTGDDPLASLASARPAAPLAADQAGGPPEQSVFTDADVRTAIANLSECAADAKTWDWHGTARKLRDARDTMRSLAGRLNRSEAALTAARARVAEVEALLGDLRALEAQSTPGPWRLGAASRWDVFKDDPRVHVANCNVDVGDAALIVAMRNALPALLALAARPASAPDAGGAAEALRDMAQQMAADSRPLDDDARRILAECEPEAGPSDA